MIQGNIEFNHKIEFFFKINGADSEYRFPENDNLVINFKVANSPTGADCQAALLPIDLLNWDALKRKKLYILNGQLLLRQIMITLKSKGVLMLLTGVQY